MSESVTSEKIQEYKELMCDIGRRIWQKGFCAGNEGNHSIRISEDRVLCTPTMQSKGFLKPENICMVDMDGNHLEPNGKDFPSSEVKVHLTLYKHNEKIRSVIHSHPPHCVAFAMAGQPLPQGYISEAEIFLGHVPLAEYDTPGNLSLAEGLLPHIKEGTNSILMANHGVVTFGENLTHTFYNLEILSATCHALILNRALGTAKPMSEEMMEELFELKAKYNMPDHRYGEVKPGWMKEANAWYASICD